VIAHRYLPLAREELIEAASFYEARVAGLGVAFLDDVARSIESGGRVAIYSVRIDIDWRAVGVLRDGEMVWLWIGPHDEYEQLLAKLRGNAV
jgi:hypothetical protein